MVGRAHPDAKVEVSAASWDQKPVLANLLELYQHDFSEFMELEIGLDGRYVYRDLDVYWTDPQRFPFLIFAGGKLAGFVLVRGIRRQTGADHARGDAVPDQRPLVHPRRGRDAARGAP